MQPLGRYGLTLKARRELGSLGLDIDFENVCDLMADLKEADFGQRIASERTGEWLCVFKPEAFGRRMYLKLAVRVDCVVISFHDDESDEQED